MPSAVSLSGICPQAARSRRPRWSSCSLSSLLSWRYHAPMQVYWGSEIFTGGARRHAEQRVIAELGKSWMMSPPGCTKAGHSTARRKASLSSDGTVSRISSGFHRMLRAAPEGTSVIPIAIIYDFMTTRRLQHVCRGRAPIADVTTLSRVAARSTPADGMAPRHALYLLHSWPVAFWSETAEAGSTSFTLDDSGARHRRGRLPRWRPKGGW